MIKTAVIRATMAALVLTGCAYDGATSNQPATGALIGGATGALLGNAIGDDARSAIIGGAIGAAVGGTIAANMARQQQELDQQLAGTGVIVTNTGRELRVILPENVTFNTGSATIAGSFMPALREIARSMIAHPNSTVRIVGHTDTVGSAAYNMRLSEERALAVAGVLIRDGVIANRITSSGSGFYAPVASNATAAGRAQNRRVEILITPTG